MGMGPDNPFTAAKRLVMYIPSRLGISQTGLKK